MSTEHSVFPLKLEDLSMIRLLPNTELVIVAYTRTTEAAILWSVSVLESILSLVTHIISNGLVVHMIIVCRLY